MTGLPGIGGALLPGRFLASELATALGDGCRIADVEIRRRRFASWWSGVEASCGPATGVRMIFDRVALPLAGLLGFRVRDAEFEPRRVNARLDTPRASVVGLIVRPWANRPSLLWRDPVDRSHAMGAQWCLLLAPPFVSLIGTRGSPLRRSLDFRLPEALEARSFDAFWRVLRAPMFEPLPNGDGRATGIDTVVAMAARHQDRVRHDLQRGVVQALAALDPVLARMRQPDKRDGRNAERRSSDHTRFDEALTIVYRLLFLLFAESRELVPRSHPVYERAYSIATFCRETLRTPDGSPGLWDGLAAVTRLSRAGCRIDDLIVRPFNGHLFSRAAAPSLERSRRLGGTGRRMHDRDAALGRALVALGTRAATHGREEIAYGDLGVEQLGTVYERILDLGPDLSAADVDDRERADGPRVRTRSAGRHSTRRKETGTFYTPQPLAEFVVRRTLAPLVRGASSDRILALRVVDPAMGSGAFLVAACRYLAEAYERALVLEGQSSETDLDTETRAGIRRLIAERCLAGVDANPVAVQLGRLSLWLTTLARGKPLGFLDHRLRVGDSLVGASPDDLWRVPDGRATPRSSQPLLDASIMEDAIRAAAGPLRQLGTTPDDTLADVRVKERLWQRLSGRQSPLDTLRSACHLWCARWFWPSRGQGVPVPAPPEIRAAIDALLHGDRMLKADHVARWLEAAASAARDRRFFHWPIEFADVFYDDSGAPAARAGFDAVIGNPPWEMLRQDDGTAETDGKADRSGRTSLLRFLRESGLYSSCGRGHLNLYRPFVERALAITRPGGRIGLVLPWGFAADESAADLRARILDAGALDTIVGLDNSAGLFPIHRGLRFVVVVAGPGAPPRDARARFGIRTGDELEALPDSDEPGDRGSFPLRLSAHTIACVGGGARRIPDLRRPDDLVWLDRLARTFPALGSSQGWQVQFGRELNATDDRRSFGTRGLPVVEGKHIGPFSVDASRATRRIARQEARRLLPDRRFEHPRLAYRDVSGVGNRLSLIAAVLPANTVSTHTLFCLRTRLPIIQQEFLCGLFNSYILNAVVRRLMGGHVTTSLVESLPAPVWTNTPLERRIARLTARLARRPSLARSHATLQALVADLFGFDVATFARLLDSFPLVPQAQRAAALRVLIARRDT